MKAYMIVRNGDTPVFKATKKEVQDWAKRNPGELQFWEEVDPLELLNENFIRDRQALFDTIVTYAAACCR